MTDRAASDMTAAELWSTLTGKTPSELAATARRTYCVTHGDVTGDHSACIVNACPWCGEPVTNAQVAEGDTFPVDERGVDDGKDAHKACARGARES